MRAPCSNLEELVVHIINQQVVVVVLFISVGVFGCISVFVQFSVQCQSIVTQFLCRYRNQNTKMPKNNGSFNQPHDNLCFMSIFSSFFCRFIVLQVKNPAAILYYRGSVRMVNVSALAKDAMVLAIVLMVATKPYVNASHFNVMRVNSDALMVHA